MILNAYLEGVIALALGVGLVVLSHLMNIAELSTPGTMLMGAGAGYMLRELGGSTK